MILPSTPSPFVGIRGSCSTGNVSGGATGAVVPTCSSALPRFLVGALPAPLAGALAGALAWGTAPLGGTGLVSAAALALALISSSSPTTSGGHGSMGPSGSTSHLYVAFSLGVSVVSGMSYDEGGQK